MIERQKAKRKRIENQKVSKQEREKEEKEIVAASLAHAHTSRGTDGTLGSEGEVHEPNSVIYNPLFKNNFE